MEEEYIIVELAKGGWFIARRMTGSKTYREFATAVSAPGADLLHAALNGASLKAQARTERPTTGKVMKDRKVRDSGADDVRG